MSKDCQICNSKLWTSERKEIDRILLQGGSVQYLKRWAKEKGISIPMAVIATHWKHLETEHRKKSSVFRDFGYYPSDEDVP